jgi:hypothetical protein
VAVSQSHAYIACEEWGIQVIDIADPTCPGIVGGADTPGSACDLAVADGFAYVTYDSSLTIMPVQCEPTSASETPMGIRLIGSHPNPFNPQTTIAFSLPESGWVSVRVLDVVGREVCVLADGRAEKGHHELIWHGKGRDGAALPSGVYVARLEAPGIEVSCKLVLLR